jgi:hypothetical protein
MVHDLECWQTPLIRVYQELPFIGTLMQIAKSDNGKLRTRNSGFVCSLFMETGSIPQDL